VDGTYVLNVQTSQVTFTPRRGFTGVVTAPVTYQVSNSYTQTTVDTSDSSTTSVVAHQTVSALLIPTIEPPGPPTALPVTSSGKPGVSQTIDVVSHDSVDPNSGATLIASSLRLCGPGDTPPNCTHKSLVTSDGTYLVNPNGSVSFVPVPGLVGTVAHPPTYSITDSLGQKAFSTITPSTVASPPISDPASPTPDHEPSLAMTGSSSSSLICGALILFAGGGLILSAVSRKKRHGSKQP
jgi:hypothetical protein